MTKHIFLFSLCALFICTGCDNDPIKKEKDEMCVLYYMIANNSLEEDMAQNMVMLYEGLAKVHQPATVIIYWKGKSSSVSSFPSPAILTYTNDGKGRINGHSAQAVVEQLQNQTSSERIRLVSAEALIARQYPSNQISTDKTTMGEIISDMVALAPEAKKYCFMTGSHGSGWLKYITGTPAVRSYGQDTDASGLQSTISTADMANILKIQPISFDLVLFDACMMACAEVAYEFRNVCNYLIGSVQEIPDKGFPYDEMLPYLLMPSQLNYVEACKKFVAFYNTLSNQGYWGAISLIDCTQMDAMAAAVRTQLLENKENIPFDISGLAFNYANNFTFASADCKHIIETLNGGNAPTTFYETLQKVVVYSDFAETNSQRYNLDRDHYSGIGMYVPGKYDIRYDGRIYTSEYWNEYYKTLEWYRAAGWNEIAWDI
ncbi:MAG: clostripain-related cysteine peptidase [Bacteroidales bacterium]|nr:clostripain-related cysteine peptidase [Bacteroidales bacterium]